MSDIAPPVLFADINSIGLQKILEKNWLMLLPLSAVDWIQKIAFVLLTPLKDWTH